MEVFLECVWGDWNCLFGWSFVRDWMILFILGCFDGVGDIYCMVNCSVVISFFLVGVVVFFINFRLKIFVV